jgi:hypothetical protein
MKRSPRCARGLSPTESILHDAWLRSPRCLAPISTATLRALGSVCSQSAGPKNVSCQSAPATRSLRQSVRSQSSSLCSFVSGLSQNVSLRPADTFSTREHLGFYIPWVRHSFDILLTSLTGVWNFYVIPWELLSKQFFITIVALLDRKPLQKPTHSSRSEHPSIIFVSVLGQ